MRGTTRGHRSDARRPPGRDGVRPGIILRCGGPRRHECLDRLGVEPSSTNAITVALSGSSQWASSTAIRTGPSSARIRRIARTPADSARRSAGRRLSSRRSATRTARACGSARADPYERNRGSTTSPSAANGRCTPAPPGRRRPLRARDREPAAGHSGIVWSCRSPARLRGATRSVSRPPTRRSHRRRRARVHDRRSRPHPQGSGVSSWSAASGRSTPRWDRPDALRK